MKKREHLHKFLIDRSCFNPSYLYLTNSYRILLTPFPFRKHLTQEKGPKWAIFLLAKLTKIECDFC